MNTTHNGNGSAQHPPDRDDEYPGAIFTVAHRDPETFLELIHALDRLLSSAGEEDFSPCTDPCPLCHPARWLANSY